MATIDGRRQRFAARKRIIKLIDGHKKYAKR